MLREFTLEPDNVTFRDALSDDRSPVFRPEYCTQQSVRQSWHPDIQMLLGGTRTILRASSIHHWIPMQTESSIQFLNLVQSNSHTGYNAHHGAFHMVRSHIQFMPSFIFRLTIHGGVSCSHVNSSASPECQRYTHALNLHLPPWDPTGENILQENQAHRIIVPIGQKCPKAIGSLPASLANAFLPWLQAQNHRGGGGVCDLLLERCISRSA